MCAVRATRLHGRCTLSRGGRVCHVRPLGALHLIQDTIPRGLLCGMLEDHRRSEAVLRSYAANELATMRVKAVRDVLCSLGGAHPSIIASALEPEALSANRVFGLRTAHVEMFERNRAGFMIGAPNCVWDMLGCGFSLSRLPLRAVELGRCAASAS